MKSNLTVIIPCHNESGTIADVIKGIQISVPNAHILVIDNASSDDTQQVARKFDVGVVSESQKGKGFAILKGLSLIDSGYVIMLDGDATYDSDDIPKILDFLNNGYDHVVGTRIPTRADAFRSKHAFGNMLFSRLQKRLLRVNVEDVFSGFRGFSNAFIQSITFKSEGFEIETHINMHSAVIGARVMNFDSEYKPRPDLSFSKLNTFRDGFRILRTMQLLLRKWRPGLYLGVPGFTCLVLSLGLFLVPLIEYFRTGVVLHVPSLVVSVSGIVGGVLLILSGLIGEMIVQSTRESARQTFRILKHLDTKFE